MAAGSLAHGDDLGAQWRGWQGPRDSADQRGAKETRPMDCQRFRDCFVQSVKVDRASDLIFSPWLQSAAQGRFG
jgi:hypothetical protein